MNLTHAALRGLSFYRRTYFAVVCGVAAAVAVLAGAWLVGHSVTSSLAGLVERRLGRTGSVVAATTPFTSALADRLHATPLFAMTGVVQHQTSSRRAGDVAVYGVDERFFTFHGVQVEAPRDLDVLLSPDLAAELSAAPDDAVLVRVTRPTDIPLDSLHGRKEDVGRTIRLRFRGVLAAEAMGEFSLLPRQGPVRAAFVPLARLQRDLALAGRVTAALVAPGVTPPVDKTTLASNLDAADLGLTFTAQPESKMVVVESAAGLVPDVAADAVRTAAAAEFAPVTPVLTWLATKMSTPSRALSYSLVSAIGPDVVEYPALDAALALQGSADPPIVLNDWAARDLDAAPGTPIEMEFYRWTDDGRLVTDRARFVVAGVAPMRGLAADRRLAPEYPGMTETKRIADWDPPFPIDLKLVRKQDEDYWDKFRATPKAFIPFAAGERLWQTRHGRLTSLRIGPLTVAPDLDAAVARIRAATMRAIDPIAAGFTVVDVRAQQLAASAGATDFGAYFSYFSFFLVVSALLLAGLFFRLGIEQRLSQIGVLRATGFRIASVRRLFLIEGAAIAVAGGVLGAILAVAWAALMMFGLRTWWVGAVGTTHLRLAVDGWALAGGALGAALAAVVAIALTLRALGRMSPRQLMTGTAASPVAGGGRRAGWVTMFAAAGAVAAAALGLAGTIPAAAGFFAAGGLALVAGLAALAAWLKKDVGYVFRPGPANRARSEKHSRRLFRLGVRNAAWRPGRSLTSAGLVAAAVFLLVSVEAFRRSGEASTDRHSGTGGYALIAESALPMIHDPASREGREALGLTMSSPDPLDGVTLTPLRLRPGDDASCLNLYQPKRPRVVGVPKSFIDAGRFQFASGDWTRLGPPGADGIVPAIADATSLQYVLHAAVGDVIEIDADTTRPHRLRIVGALRDSVLQGELMVAEDAFRTIFPDVAGYRMLFVDVAPARADEVARVLEERLEPYGVDAQDTARRLAAYHQVENTYLSTFQALGGLGLVLGVVGLAAVIARNVLERRRELALLAATGFTRRDLGRVVAGEQLGLLAAGLVIGLAAALVAIAPVLVARGGRLPALSFVWLALVALAGVISTLFATRLVRRLPIVASLRSE